MKRLPFWYLFAVLPLVSCEQIPTDERICAFFDLRYVDNGPEHFWTDNDGLYPAAGLHIEVQDENGVRPFVLNWRDDDPEVGMPQGCVTAPGVKADHNHQYTVRPLNTSTVNGITFHSYAYHNTTFHTQPPICSGPAQPDCSEWTQPQTVTTTSPAEVELDEGPAEAAHASATQLFRRHHFNLGTPPTRVCCDVNSNPDGTCTGGNSDYFASAEDIRIFVETGPSQSPCPAGGGSPMFTEVPGMPTEVHPNGVRFSGPCASKWLHGHEYGHLVLGMRMGHMGHGSYEAPLDQCQGSMTVEGADVLSGDRQPLGKEYTSIALREGWGDFIAAWMWNESGGSNCISRGRLNNLFDYDIDGTPDNRLTWVTSDPIANQVDYTVIDCGPDGPWVTDPPWPTDFTDVTAPNPAIDGVNWLRDVMVESATCGPAAVDSRQPAFDIDENRSSLFDVVRMFWSLHAEDGIDVGTLADIYIDMCPRDWSRTDDFLDPGQFERMPLERLKISAELQPQPIAGQVEAAAEAHLR